MARDQWGRTRMPTAVLGAGGPVVSRIGLGLAALGRPAYITVGREDDLPDRTVAGLRAETFSMLDAAYAAGGQVRRCGPGPMARPRNSWAAGLPSAAIRT